MKKLVFILFATLLMAGNLHKTNRQKVHGAQKSKLTPLIRMVKLLV